MWMGKARGRSHPTPTLGHAHATGHVHPPQAIQAGLANRLRQMSEERERAARAAAADDEEFSSEFLYMARKARLRRRFVPSSEARPLVERIASRTWHEPSSAGVEAVSRF